MVEQAIDMGFKIDDVPYGGDAITEYNRPIGEYIKKTKRFYPNIHGTQGFFIAKLKR